MKTQSPPHTSRRILLGALLFSGLVATGLGQNSINPAGKPAKPDPLEARVAALESHVATLTATVEAQAAHIRSLTNLLAHFSRVDNDIYITGANLNIRDGTGHTWGEGTFDAPEANGLGNLIIGYNESDDFLGGQSRLGSHNLVLGAYHSYPTVSGFVAGFRNTVSGRYSSVLGGHRNTAGGNGSAVTGGEYNTAGGYMSCLGGGNSRSAPGGWNWAAGSLLEPQ